MGTLPRICSGTSVLTPGKSSLSGLFQKPGVKVEHKRGASELVLSQKNSKTTFFVLLYGSLEYDGRVKRMTEILKRIGHVTVMDINRDNSTFLANDSITRSRVTFSKVFDNKIGRHLFFWLAAIRKAFLLKPSIIVAEDYFTTFSGWCAAKLCNAKLIYDAHELIIPEPNQKMGKRNKFWYFLEKWTVHRADLIIAANRERANLMCTHYSLKQKPVVMRNISMPQKSKVDSAKLLKQFPSLARQSKDEIILLYQGDMSLSRGIARFVQALKYLDSKFRLVLVGGGPDLDHLKKLGLPFEREGRFVALGRVEHDLLPAITASADLGIVCYPYRGLNNIYCASNKIFEYAMAGLPILSTNQPPLEKTVKEFQVGKLVGEHDSPEYIATLIKKLAENKTDYKKNVSKFVENFSWEEEATRVEKSITDLLADGG